MEEKDLIEPNEETRARGVKRSSDIKIAEVTTSKKKRSKKPPAESPEPAQAEINFNNQDEQSEESVKRSRMFEAVADVAEGVSSRPLYMPVAHLETQISRIHILDI